MKLEDVLNGVPKYMHMERFVNQRRYSHFCEYSEVSERYRPSSSNSSFDLPCFLVPSENVDLYLANRNNHIGLTYLSDIVPFRVHPDILSIGKDEKLLELRRYPQGESIAVAPTASTRTVLTLDQDYNHFIKLHLPKRISRFNRRLRATSVEHSIQVSKDLENIALNGFAYLSETIGIVYGGSSDGFGFLIRETRPRPYMHDGHLIPYFALYSQDVKNPEDKPLLVQMIDQRNEMPTSFVINKIISPLIEQWCKIVNERGILLEPHGQNTLLEVDPELNPRRVVHRDFQNLMVDPIIRGENGLEMPFKKHLIEVDGYFHREQEYSLVYDYFIGHHLFGYLVEILP